MITQRYFFYDPEEGGFSFFATAAERDAEAAKALEYYRQEALEDGWPDAVFMLRCGVVTHAAHEVNRVERVGELDEGGYDEADEQWDDEECTVKCDVVMVPLPPEDPA